MAPAKGQFGATAWTTVGRPAGVHREKLTAAAHNRPCTHTLILSPAPKVQWSVITTLHKMISGAAWIDTRNPGDPGREYHAGAPM